MIRQLLTYGNTFCAVEHTVDAKSLEVFYALQLKKVKKELTSSNKDQYSSKPELFENLKAQKHLFLIVNNQHVLLKKVDATVLDKENAVKAVFPSVKMAEFYYEFSQNKEGNFVAICRKTYIDNLIAEYQTKGISVIGFSLQNLVIRSLMPFLKQSEIETSNSTVSFSEHKIVGIEKSNFDTTEYDINELKISNKHILCLSGILSYFYNTVRNASNFDVIESGLKTRYDNHRFNSVGFKAALGIVFSILLINFMIFSRAHSEMTRLNNDVLINSNSKNELLQLQKRVKQKVELTKSINSLSSSKTTWYLNELGKSIPKKIQLSIIYFQPLSKSIKKNKEIKVTENTILVKGISKNNDSFSNWTSELELKHWIEKIVIISHGKGKNSTSTFEFTIKIKS